MFLFSSSLGYAPGDTNNKVLAVKYLYGGGPGTNVDVNTSFRIVSFSFNNISRSAQSAISNSISMINNDKIAGGISSRNQD
jgi:hypothetical protein